MTEPGVTLRLDGKHLLVSAPPELAERLGWLFTREKIRYTWDGEAGCARVGAAHRAAIERWAARAQVAVIDATPAGQIGAPAAWVAGYAVAGVRRAADGALHQVAWLPGEGFFCDCDAEKRCPAVKAAQQALSGSVRSAKARTRRTAPEGTGNAVQALTEA